ncbi:hypothetical protein J4E06_11410 [Muricauda sp. NFXS6]|uniref:hypothetical protein n=1 Tax=Allomuricauda sp. NFXS6 TaxID=2819094 RepID=UPI0032DEB0FB|tara:strand:+ start:7832 stop:8131 length:300 start_codon:yes stop_codon:yes gene_type:complete
MSKYHLVFVASILTLFSCEKQEENLTHYYIYIAEECLDRERIAICVAKEEFERIRQISIANEEGEDESCLIVNITDLTGNTQEAIFKGYGFSKDDWQCD